MTAKKKQFIEFDLHFEDFKKVTILVINLLSDDIFPASNSKIYHCDIFNDEECHHNENHLNLHDLCHFCQFVKLLRDKFSVIKINNQNDSLSVKYRTYYSPEILEWSEFQVRRTPYILFGYGFCHNQSDLLLSVKNFEKIKALYQKTLIKSKLFVNFLMSKGISDTTIDIHDLSRLSSSLPEYNIHPLELGIKKQSSEVSSNTSNLDNESLYSVNQGKEVDDKASVNFDEINTLNNSDLINQVNSLPSNLNNFSSVKESEKINIVNKDLTKHMDLENIEPELNQKLKILEKEKNIIYLDYKLGHLDKTEFGKIEINLNEALSFIHKKLLDLSKFINPGEEKQINYYSEYLKTPIENKGSNSKATGSTVTESFSLSIKVINKKIVSARMHKHKADIYLLLNMTELSIYHYSQAYYASKKEEDFLWAYGALEGLCIASYLYMQQNPKHENSQNKSQGNMISLHEKSKNPSFKDLRNSIKKSFATSSKDFKQHIVPMEEYKRRFEKIVLFYNTNVQTMFIAFESALMISKLLIMNNLKEEGFYFINFTIYISNLEIHEEFKIRRYLEIAKLYESYDMKRWSAFYKWISAGRVFRLFSKTHQQTDNIHLKCLAKRCTNQILELFSILNILPQLTPAAQTYDTGDVQIGFPYAKKNLVDEVIKLFYFVFDRKEFIKFSKYLLNQMSDYLKHDELIYYIDFLTSNAKNNDNHIYDVDDKYLTKFYRFPILSSFKIILNTPLEANKLSKIRVEAEANNIYKYRYENPLFSVKKKTIYNLQINRVNKIEFTFSNPIPIDLTIENIHLLAEKDKTAEKFIIEPLFENSQDIRTFILPGGIKEYKVKFKFVYESLENFEIIGYAHKCFNCHNEIFFNELNQNESNKKSRNINKNQFSIQSSYRVEMIPKLSTIKDIKFISKSISLNNDMIYSLSELQEKSLDLKLGTKQKFNLNLELDGAIEPDFQILKCDLIILNENNAEKCKAKISIVEEVDNSHLDILNRYFLEVDTTDFYSDIILNENDLDISFMLDFEYTNNSANDKNLCYKLRTKVFVKFSQVIHLTLKNIDDIDENTYKLNLLVKNLVDSSIFLSNLTTHYENTTLAEIMGKNCIEYSLVLNKLDLNKKSIDTVFSMTTLVNDSLKIMFGFSRTNAVFFPLNFFSQESLLRYKNIIFQSPIKFTIKLDPTFIEKNTPSLRSIMLIGLIKQSANLIDSNYNFVISLTNRLKNVIYADAFKWCLKKDDLLKSYWLKELRILENGSDLNQYQFSIKLAINNTFSDQSFKNFEWIYKCDLRENNLSYVLN